MSRVLRAPRRPRPPRRRTGRNGRGLGGGGARDEVGASSSCSSAPRRRRRRRLRLRLRLRRRPSPPCGKGGGREERCRLDFRARTGDGLPTATPTLCRARIYAYIPPPYARAVRGMLSLCPSVLGGFGVVCAPLRSPTPLLFRYPLRSWSFFFFSHTHTASALGEEIEKEQSGGRRSALRWKGGLK